MICSTTQCRATKLGLQDMRCTLMLVRPPCAPLHPTDAEDPSQEVYFDIVRAEGSSFFTSRAIVCREGAVECNDSGVSNDEGSDDDDGATPPRQRPALSHSHYSGLLHLQRGPPFGCSILKCSSRAMTPWLPWSPLESNACYQCRATITLCGLLLVSSFMVLVVAISNRQRSRGRHSKVCRKFAPKLPV